MLVDEIAGRDVSGMVDPDGGVQLELDLARQPLFPEALDDPLWLEAVRAGHAPEAELAVERAKPTPEAALGGHRRHRPAMQTQPQPCFTSRMGRVSSTGPKYL